MEAGGLTEPEQLELAINALEERRAVLGDAVVDLAIGPMRQRLAELTTSRRSQRRHVTVLFADVVGYTSLAERLDPEGAGAFVDRLWGTLGRVIVEHRGRVLQHLGDGVMALWGGEYAQEDDAEWAIRAGLTMIEEGRRLEIDGIPAQTLKLRVGINTGLVHMGHVGVTEEFRVTGDTVNVASRLESNAEHGTVLISRSTYNQVRGVFDISHVGDLALKGRTEMTPAYRVDRLRPRAFRVRSRGVEGLETRMVGRGPHLSRVVAAHRAATEGGDSRVVVVTGEPGVGKSRLLYEYRDWIETESATRVRWFEGRCLPETSDRPLGLIRDIFANRFEISDDDAPETVNLKFNAGLSDLFGDSNHLSATFSWLLGFGANLGEEDSRGLQMRRKLALDELVRSFHRLGSETPAVIALEDVHWADSNSLDLLEHVIAARPPRIVFVVVTRPSLREERHGWVSERGLGEGHVVVPLEYLSPNEVKELVVHILRHADHVPESLLGRVVSQSDGNPLHVEELIKILIDDGVISTGPIWHVDERRLQSHLVPETLTGVLQARLDRLPPGQFRVLQRASVFGRYFWTEAIEAIGDENENAGADLDGLVQAELVFPRSPSRFQNTAELGFKHEFTRAVAYDTIGLAKRPELHRRAAEWLERNAGLRMGEFALEIARHYEVAGDRQTAFAWYGQAARHAENQSAYDEASRLWSRSVDLATSEVERTASLFALAYALVVAGEFEQARGLLSGLRATPPAGDFHQGSTQMLVRAELARIAIFLDGNFPLARELLNEGLAMASGDETVTAELMLRHQLGNLAIWLGDFNEAVQIHERNVERAGEGGEFYRRGWGLNSLSNALIHVGDLDRALRVANRVIRAADELGDPRLRMAGIAHKGVVCLHRGEWTEALAWFSEAQELNRRNGDPEKISTVANYLGEAALFADLVPRAAAEFTEALEIGRRAGALPEQLRALTGLAAIAAAHGNLELAEEGIAIVEADPAAYSEVHRLASVVCERYDLTVRPPTRERADVLVALEAAATGTIDPTG